MTTKEEYDQYAAELTRRFDEYVQWAITHWPKREFPLLPSDFSASRREISQIVGPKLGDSEESNSAGLNRNAGQFRDMNPMPWP